MNNLQAALQSMKSAQESLRAEAKESIGPKDEHARWCMARLNEFDAHVQSLEQKLKQLAKNPE